MPKSLSLTHKNSAGHAAILYENADERMRLLARYFREGLEKHELCVLVTPQSIDLVLTQLHSYGLDARSAVADGALRIFDMHQTYLPNGEFVSDYMLQNVETFLHEAKSAGFSGLRTAGEMSWLQSATHAHAEAEHYESDVNKFCQQHEDFIGLCMYPAPQSSEANTLRSILKTHPTYVQHEKLHMSPHYA